MVQTDFATWLRIEMAKRDVNDVGLAQIIDVSHMAVGHWRRGERVPNYGNCVKLARIFNVPEEEVLLLTGHKNPTVIGNRNDQLRDRQPSYYIGPRARLHELIDDLTEDQAQMLETFLNTIK